MILCLSYVNSSIQTKLQYRTEAPAESCPKVEKIVDFILKHMSKFQVLEIVRALHYYIRELPNDELLKYPNLNSLYNMDEQVLIDEVRYLAIY